MNSPYASPDFDRRLHARKVLLSEVSPRQKLAAITGGDPLGLFTLGVERVRERCFYLDPDRIYDAAVFRVVGRASELKEEDPFDEWLQDRVDEAIDGLISSDREMGRKDVLDPDVVRASATFLSGCWGLEEEESVRAAIRFNGLAERNRRTFFELLVRQRTFEECTEMGLGPTEEIRERTVRAIEAILGPRPSTVSHMRLPGDPATESDPS